MKPQVSAPSPALTIETTSTPVVDGEEDDEEVIVLDHLSVRRLFHRHVSHTLIFLLVKFDCRSG